MQDTLTEAGLDVADWPPGLVRATYLCCICPNFSTVFTKHSGIKLSRFHSKKLKTVCESVDPAAWADAVMDLADEINATGVKINQYTEMFDEDFQRPLDWIATYIAVYSTHLRAEFVKELFSEDRLYIAKFRHKKIMEFKTTHAFDEEFLEDFFQKIK